MDGFIEIEAENSAWDTLKESFIAAATKGHYLDLTQGAVKEISAIDAAKEFSGKPALIDPKSIVQDETATANSSHSNLSLIAQTKLKPIRDCIKHILMLLQHTRKCLMAALQQKLQVSANITNEVNWGVAALQNLINEVDPDIFYMSKDTIKSIEHLNKLVVKANILISEYNLVMTTENDEYDEEYHEHKDSVNLMMEGKEVENANTPLTIVKEEIKQHKALRRSGRMRQKPRIYNP